MSRENRPGLCYTTRKTAERKRKRDVTYRVLLLADEASSDVPWAAEDEVSYEVGSEAGLASFSNGSAAVRPDAVLLDLSVMEDQRARVLASRCRDLGLPVMGVLTPAGLATYDPSLALDDFILETFQPGELLVRLKQMVFRSSGTKDQKVVAAGDLVIDTERYEVTLASKRVLLTYKEYQLLLLLASNPGRVYTRDGLLSHVWRYDYFGGTRTVDVHVRRLRSKIEDADHSFIETVWNVGYRFKPQS